jgi:hypothetical protein
MKAKMEEIRIVDAACKVRMAVKEQVYAASHFNRRGGEARQRSGYTTITIKLGVSQEQLNGNI